MEPSYSEAQSVKTANGENRRRECIGKNDQGNRSMSALARTKPLHYLIRIFHDGQARAPIKSVLRNYSNRKHTNYVQVLKHTYESIQIYP